MRYLSDDDMNALDYDPVRVNGSDSDLSDGVKCNLFNEGSIVGDCDSTNSANCEIENKNIINSSSSECSVSVQ